MEKKLKKKTHLKIIPVLIFLLLIVAIFFIYNLISSLPVKNIYITGNTYLTDQEIIELAKLENYPSFIKTTSATIKKNIEKNKLIKHAKITKKFFGIVEITVEENNILFRKYDDDTKVILDNGSEVVDDKYSYSVPKLLNYVPDTKYKSFMKGMNQVTENIKIQISEITYLPNEQDKDRFLLYMNDGNYVYLTLTKFKQINYYEDVLGKLKGKKGILYLDSGNHFQIMEG